MTGNSVNAQYLFNEVNEERFIGNEQ